MWQMAYRYLCRSVDLSSNTSFLVHFGSHNHRLRHTSVGACVLTCSLTMYCNTLRKQMHGMFGMYSTHAHLPWTANPCLSLLSVNLSLIFRRLYKAGSAPTAQNQLKTMCRLEADRYCHGPVLWDWLNRLDRSKGLPSRVWV